MPTRPAITISRKAFDGAVYALNHAIAMAGVRAAILGFALDEMLRAADDAGLRGQFVDIESYEARTSPARIEAFLDAISNQFEKE